MMKSLGTSYTMYFNKKYEREGHLFQGRYKAVRINNDSYLFHITRYVHLNPINFSEYKYSSYQAYLGNKIFPYLKANMILELFPNSNYQTFVESMV
jgi:putative transposase